MQHVLIPCVLIASGVSPAAQCGIEASVDAFGQGTAGTVGVPELRGVGGPLLDNHYHVQVLRGPSSAPGLVFASLVEVDIAQPLFGGFQYVGAPYVVGTFALDAGGDSPPLLSLHVDPALCGLTAVAQAALIDPGAQGGAALTNGLRVRFGITSGPLFPAAEYFGGEDPQDVAHADLDADGVPDLLLAGQHSNDVLVFRGRGDGTFESAVSYATFGWTMAMAVEDYDRDGNIDVAVTNSDADLVALLLGNGDGTFAPAVGVPVGDAPRALDAGDLDQDGILDLAVACIGPSQIQVLFGNGDGTFGSSVTFATGTALTVLIEDVDADGVTDLVWREIFGIQGGIYVRLGQGGGAAGPKILAYSAFSSDPGLALGDLDQDGFLDAVQPYGDGVHLLLGQGDGTFTLLEHEPVGNNVWDIAIQDLDQDGVLDLAVVNENTDDVAILLGTGDGSAALFENVPVGSHPVAITVTDLDGDGVPDFATANTNQDNISVRVGMGDGAFRYGEVLPKGGIGSGELAIADFDDDGANDIVVVNDYPASGNLVSFIFGAGGGLFEDTVDLPVGDVPQSVVVRDFDGDGYPDPGIARENIGTKIFTGVHAKDFAAGVGIPTLSYPLESADFDGNGTSDLVGGHGPTGVSVALNQGGAVFAPAVGYPQLPGEYLRESTVGDFDGDGVPDIASRFLEENVGTIALGLGDGAFGPASTFDIVWVPSDIETADLDQDGDLDLALPTGSILTLMRGNGDGTFAPPEGVPVKSDSVSFGDVNHDGLVDVILSQSLEVAVLLAAGGGAFAEPLNFAGNGVVGEIAIGDLDGDGVLDLAVNNFNWSVLVLRNLLLE